MTAGPWIKEGGLAPQWVRYCGSFLLCYVHIANTSAHYRGQLTAFQRRGCDDLTGAAKTCNAGLRLLGIDCDDSLPEGCHE